MRDVTAHALEEVTLGGEGWGEEGEVSMQRWTLRLLLQEKDILM